MIRLLLSAVVLSIPESKLDLVVDTLQLPDSIVDAARQLLQCDFDALQSHVFYGQLLATDSSKSILGSYSGNGDLKDVLRLYLRQVVVDFREHFQQDEIASFHLQIFAIILLQQFIQLNYTGPPLPVTSSQVFFPEIDGNSVQNDAVRLLNIEGIQAYELMIDPLLLVMAGLLFEILMDVDERLSLLGMSSDVTIEELSERTLQLTKANENDPVYASLRWWRSRAIQVHISILTESSGLLLAVLSLLLCPEVVTTLAPADSSDPELQRHLQIVYFLECARAGVHSNTEHLSIPLLGKARSLSHLEFVLTGAKAKRTKFQTFHTSMLVMLAKSQRKTLYDMDADKSQPERFELDSDLLLERPVFESLDDVEIPNQPNQKKIKLDDSVTDLPTDEEVLIPLALTQDQIPSELRDMDPNNQPCLNDIDNLQLLLRFTILKQTSPAHNPLVEEELAAIVSRVLYTNTDNANWTIFSRALWDRSILETSKARTVERGILQMTSLVEEIGIKIKTRVIPQTQDLNSADSSPTASRLRFIHQLPLMPQWQLDVQLADKYMSLGVLRSAVEIYTRLQLACEAALCYAAVEDETEAKRILEERISTHPDDARAISILGDITGDPSLWEKAWTIGRYSKAKASLSHFYYSPPASSNLVKNLELAIKNMNECLTANPLSYENWFFYGCCGLELAQYDLAAEAFTRCVSLDDTNSRAWSNLATALLRLDKTRPAFNALKKAIRSAGEGKKSWRIFENYCIVAFKLGEWNEVLMAVRELIDIRGETDGEVLVDIPVVEKLIEILVATAYPEDIEGSRLSHYQAQCIDLVCNLIPRYITTSARCWRMVARVELWRRRPWAALEAHEKAYRALSNSAAMQTDETLWNEAVDACDDLVAAYESLGELPGKHNAGDVVCLDWKYKARSAVRSLMSKGKSSWEDSPGWEKLQNIKSQLT